MGKKESITRGYNFTYVITVISNSIDVGVVEIFSRFSGEGVLEVFIFEETGMLCKKNSEWYTPG